MLDAAADRGAQPRKGDRQAPHQRAARGFAPFRAALSTQSLAAVNGQPGEPRSFDRLDALLDDQSYRLAFWRVAAEEINYRRFFDITELAAVRMEDPTVFQDTHRLLLRLVGEGKIQGLRIDHPDGLRDPAGTCGSSSGISGTAPGTSCQTRTMASLAEAEASRRRRPARSRHDGFYVVVEKILGADERLRAGLAGPRHHRLRLPERR